MEPVMQNYLAHLLTFQARFPFGSWHSALKRWGATREIRRQKRKYEEIMTQLTPEVRYDIGDNDCRPPRSGTPCQGFLLGGGSFDPT
jgi:hypothetical protein